GIGSIAFQGDQILLADSANLFRVGHDGKLDGTFGANGVATVNLSFNIANIAVQRDGSVVAAGPLFDNIFIAHFSANGVFDKTFAGGKGLVEIVETGFVTSTGLALQADGKIVLTVDNNDAHFQVTRLNAKGSPDATFGPHGNGRQTIAFDSANEFGGA